MKTLEWASKLEWAILPLLNRAPPSRSGEAVMTTHNDEEFREAVILQVMAYTKLFEAQVEVTHSWPEKFHFPEPANNIEHEAMRLFVDEVERKMGTRIQIVHS
jgi:hypothetical protein